MTVEYEAFCLVDPVFYDVPGARTAGDLYACAHRPMPGGWRRDMNDEWVMHVPDEGSLPAQGWKVHVSAGLDNAARIIDATWEYCTARQLAFKFLRGPRTVLARNGKYAGRGGSGKVVTVYPRDEAELEVVCKDLDARLDGEHGPTILSDLRWGGGPVHVRYGAFVPRYTTDDRGEVVPAIEDASGRLVADERGPVFSVPPWVELPECLEPHLAARAAVTVADLPYTVDAALHFSNGGGVYLGTDKRTGSRIVLKEARPHAGIAADGSDAVARLRHERDMLTRLAGVDAVPALLDHFVVGEHEFIAMEYIEGKALNKELVGRYPLAGEVPDEAELAEHARWAVSVHAAITEAVAQIHDRGVVYNDLHLRNVIVRPDGRPALIDFEVADELGREGARKLGAAGYAAPADWRGPDVDRYALACLKIGLLLPLERLIGLDRTKAVHLAEIITGTFPVPDGWLDDALALLAPEASATPPATWTVEPDAAGWAQARDSIAAGIVASATLGRDDRLFPGDIAQFAKSGGVNLAHGAAGVLLALHLTGAGRHPDFEDWLITRTRRPGEGSRLGFYDGLHGVAHVLAHLGHDDDARRLLDVCLSERWEILGDDLFGGVAGIGLNCAHFAEATGDPALGDAALRAAQLVVDRLGTVDDVPTTSGGPHPRAGLLHGSAGRALLLIRMYERTGDDAFLDHAATALRQDLRRCVRRASGALHVDEDWRTLPYLGSGSIGIGLVLHRYLRHRGDDELHDAAEAIGRAARSVLYVQPGLFDGRAGIILHLADGRDAGRSDKAETAAQVRRLGWHALSYRGGLAFPGDRLQRLSMDLATGGAGVLLALGAALADHPVSLPFLGPVAPTTGSAPGPSGPTRDERGRGGDN